MNLTRRTFLAASAILAVTPPRPAFSTRALRVGMGESTMAVQALYREGGFDIGAEFREPPDHIAAELEFLYLLMFRENEAQREGKPDALEAKTALRERFLDEHLGRWAGPFSAAVKAGAQTIFYRQLAELTQRFVGMQAVTSRAH